MTRFVDGLTDADAAAFNLLMDRLEAYGPHNALLAAYYDAYNELVMASGGSIPPGWDVIAAVLGWPAKGVDKLDERCNLEGFALPGSNVLDAGIERVWRENRLASESSQVGVSSLIHGVSWLVVVRGEVGEPNALVVSKSAREATGDWDARARRLRSFLSVHRFGSDGFASEVTLYVPGRNVPLRRSNGRWRAGDVQPTGRDYVMAYPLVFKPRLGRPFGHSRITRPVRQLTDSAMRGLLRAEVNAELYSTPQRVLLGADASVFMNVDGTPKSGWEIMMGRWFAVPSDEDTDKVPSVQQLAQATQQPHMDHIAMLAKLCSAEMSIPVTEMGISTDANPASAEALRAHQDALISLGERTIADWSEPYRLAMLDALAINEGVREIPAEWQGLRPVWRSPEHTSLASQSDSLVKLSAVAPWLAESETWIDMLQLDVATKERLKADLRRFGATSTLRQSLAAAGAGGEV